LRPAQSRSIVVVYLHQLECRISTPGNSVIAARQWFAHSMPCVNLPPWRNQYREASIFHPYHFGAVRRVRGIVGAADRAQ
jgi:predicted 2-oxoglutarate/Fe(II)-dependent dioxygenase YbiX